MAEGKTLGAKQVATRIGTDAKTFRKFLRQTGEGVGQGRRYDFPEAQVPGLKRRFNDWLDQSKAPKTKSAEKPVVQQMKVTGVGKDKRIVAAEYVEEDEDLELDLDDDEDREPSMDELMEIAEDDDEIDDLDDEEDD